MRLSIVIFMLLFLAFAFYVGWEGGAFDFKRIEVLTSGERPVANATSNETEKLQSEVVENEILKSDERPRMKEPTQSLKPTVNEKR